MKVKSFNIIEFLVNSKELVYPIITYISGLLIGSFLMTYSNVLSSAAQKVFSLQYNSFYDLFFNRLCVYISVFAITVILGLCLIGYPFINLIPLITGAEIGLKTAYYYINYSVKGVGYSLLVILPESAAFMTVLILTISVCSKMSKSIFKLTQKNSDTAGEINLKLYLKKLLIYTGYVILISLINAGAVYLLCSLITL